MSELDNAILAQNIAVAKHRAAHEKRMFRNLKDIRDEIAQGAHYNPKDDPPYEYQPYPKCVRRPGLPDVVVNSKEEHDSLLGVKAEPAKKVTVDVASLQKPDVVPAKRGRPPKAAVAPLPANLD